jgi:hypothetical protein
MTHAAHVHRPSGAGNRRRKAAAVQAADHPPGFFTALVLQHNWPPMWQPAEYRWPALRGAAAAAAALPVLAAAQRRAAAGVGWGKGTLPMPGTPKHEAPGYMPGLYLPAAVRGRGQR